ncbi:MAG: AraC family transcriptional regulator [Ignavibacteriae bacterium]|nr:MAG: AraC family transcriptional regulator [Ignavibacteriota bacterium]
MPTTILRIKNMVCPRCSKVVKEELDKLGYTTTIERLGSARIEYSQNYPDINKISQMLEKNGFELLIDKNAKIIDNIKTLIIDLIYQDRLENMNTNLSDYLVQNLNYDYSFLTTLFSSVESITIEKYFILQKIERVKEQLIYAELTLSEIAYRLGYSNVQYLSNQFKKVTGMSPSQFKSLRGRARNSIDTIGSD